MAFLDFLSAAGQGLSSGLQAHDALQQRERQQAIEDKEREERGRLLALEKAMLELNIEGGKADLEAARRGPQPTYGVGADGRPTMSGATDPQQVLAFQKYNPPSPEEPDPINWQTIQTPEGYVQANPRTAETRPLMGPDGQLRPPPPASAAGPRRGSPDTIINQVVSGFRTETSDHRDAAQGYQAMRGAYEELQRGNPAAALGMLFAYGKILDPGSVVREGELKTLQQIGAYDERVKNWLSMATRGEMTPEIADAIMAVAENTMRMRGEAFRGVREGALSRAEIQGLDRNEMGAMLPDYYSSFGQAAGAGGGGELSDEEIWRRVMGGPGGP